MAIRGRQLWIDGVAKWCHHAVLDPIRSEEGKIIAEICAACSTRVAEHGKCHGCGQERRLVYFIASKRQAYHSEDCYRQMIAAHKKAAAAKRAEAAAKGAR